ncbi:MAG: cell division protein SepF [Clostridia bacterium]|nr:cell division protein SepF [Clostridia bacterium]
MGLFDKIKGMVSVDPYGDDYGKEETEEEVKQEENLVPAKVAAQKPALGISGQEDSVVELKVVRPETFANVTEIADYLLNHCTVVLNLEATNREVAKRLIDFLAGVAYSIDGQLKNVANNTYIITPCNVDVADTQVRVAEAQQNFANQTTNTNSDLTSDSLF